MSHGERATATNCCACPPPTEWGALWMELAVRVESLASLGLPLNTPDVTLWQFCQMRLIFLITGNRNQDGPESLEAVIQASCTLASLPVLTIGEPNAFYQRWDALGLSCAPNREKNTLPAHCSSAVCDDNSSIVPFIGRLT